MKRYIKKILLWLFKDKVRMFRINQYIADTYITDIKLTKDKFAYEDCIKRNMAIKLVQELLKQGAIEIETWDDNKTMGRNYQAEIYVLIP